MVMVMVIVMIMIVIILDFVPAVRPVPLKNSLRDLETIRDALL